MLLVASVSPPSECSGPNCIYLPGMPLGNETPPNRVEGLMPAKRRVRTWLSGSRRMELGADGPEPVEYPFEEGLTMDQMDP